jgi:tetratricopeptide (TPR) repeat protein
MKTKSIFAALVALLLALGAMPAWSQTVLVRANGRVTDGGKPLAGAQVVFTHQDSGRQTKEKIGKTGDFSMIGLQRGFYTVEIFNVGGESVFKKGNINISNDQGVVDAFTIDISNPSAATLGNMGSTSAGTGTGKLTKEQEAEQKEKLKQVEAIKESNKKAEGENTLIAQLNPAMQAQNWPAAEPILQQLIAINPARWEYMQALGNAQLNQGKYEEAVVTYEKAIPLAQNPGDPKSDAAKGKAAVGQMLTNEGNAYLKLKKTPEAIAAYNRAAELSTNKGTAYFNICATQYNIGNMEGAAVACDKAIAADPNKADAYFIKGSALYGNGKLDKDNKYVVPPGTTEALNKYLELAPDGGHAVDVRAMLQALGKPFETTYKERKKK